MKSSELRGQARQDDLANQAKEPKFGLIQDEDRFYAVIQGPQRIRLITYGGIAYCSVGIRGEVELNNKLDSHMLKIGVESFLKHGDANVEILPPPQTPLEKAKDALSQLDRTRSLRKLAIIGRDSRPDDQLGQRGTPEAIAEDRDLSPQDREAILAILQTGSSSERQAATCVLEEWAGAWGIDPLLRCLWTVWASSSVDAALSEACILALGQLGGPKVTAFLVKIAKNPEDTHRDRTAALSALLDLMTGCWERRMQSGNPPKIPESRLKVMQQLLLEMSLLNDECTKHARDLFPEFEVV